MKLNLKNIGIIEDSSIEISGLTVITGKNNSGKSTVGKMLYSIIDAVSNMEQKYQNDCDFYLSEQLERIINALECSSIMPNDILVESDNRLVKTLFNREYRFRNLEEDATSLFEEVGYTLENTDIVAEIKKVIEANEHIQMEFKWYGGKYFDDFPKMQRKALTIWKQAKKILRSDPNRTDYAKRSIDRTLQLEFEGQIQPVRFPKAKSAVTLAEGETEYFSFTIEDNHIVSDNPYCSSTPYNKAYLIDDPLVLNQISNTSNYLLDNPFIARRLRSANDYGQSVLNQNRIFSHNQKLARILGSGKNISILEETAIDVSLASLKEKINEIIPGEFAREQNGFFYITDGIKLRTGNLATGSKMFSIIKMLLNRGELTEETVLILDEPESHLHPEWQNEFAEIVLLLVKEQNIPILLTTHSPNMLLALETFMKKYQLEKKCNFYQTQYHKDSHKVDYSCVNNNLNTIYADFVKYFSEMKALNDGIIAGLDSEI